MTLEQGLTADVDAQLAKNRSSATIQDDRTDIPPEDTMATRLFRTEQGYAVQTECLSEEEFTQQFSVLLARLIAQDTYAGHWDAVLTAWLPQLVNICCAYRGYPVPEVTIRTLYTAGRLPTTAVEPAHPMHDEAQVPESAEPDAQGTAKLMRRLWKTE